MNQILKVLVLLSLVSSCKSQNCNQLPISFSNFDSALSEIYNSDFELEDKVNISKSSWIKGASYYSCDLSKGFFVLKTDSKDYLHQDVPLKTWQEFKTANSFGSYYSKNIKGRFQVKIKI